MRIAYVCADRGVPVFGRKGASVHVQGVLGSLLARGHEVHLVAARVGDPQPDALAAVQVHELPPVAAPDTDDGPAVRERVAQARDATIAGVLDGLASTAPFDLLYERCSLWGRTATAWAARTGTSSILEVNAPLVDEQARHRGLVDRAAAEAVAREACSSAAVVACVSGAVADWVRVRSAHPERVHVVPNGVDAARIRPSSRSVIAADERPFVLGFVGTLKSWHGVATLVDALHLLEREDPGAYRLLLVGDGPERERVLAQARRAGVSDLVEHTGAVHPDEVEALLHRMDVGIAPYPPLPDFYFSPLKVLDYLCAGLPVVASRLGQIPDLLEGGALGTLVRPGSAEDLADAIAVLRADEPRRAAVRTAAREAVLRRHTWDAVVDRLLALVPVGRPAAAG